MSPSRPFVLHMFSKHGVPSHVTSNRGLEFVSNFFRSLGTAFDMWLHFTSGYHPEGDGQTERTNQTLKQYLHVYCNYQQDNWSELLPLTEFAYNNAPSATTGVSSSQTVDLVVLYSSFHLYFCFDLFLYFLFLDTTRARVDQSCCHTSHLIAKSQDKS